MRGNMLYVEWCTSLNNNTTCILHVNPPHVDKVRITFLAQSGTTTATTLVVDWLRGTAIIHHLLCAQPPQQHEWWTETYHTSAMLRSAKLQKFMVNSRDFAL